MLTLLQKGKADGVVIHKIDRSARNLKDWAEIGQLAESGIEVHFANEAVDLSSSTGMLSADVQAVVAAHYIRNLREEVKKGYYGRLKQGLCPYPAPLGYLNCGQGKPKTLDPERASIIRKAFELYATGKYSQQEVASELARLGLRTRKGEKLSKNAVGRMLASRFYIGELYVKKVGQTFAGIHEPLVSPKLFERVQQVMSGKYVLRPRSHRFIFSRLISCRTCGRSLIAERQKGHVYYRCLQRHNAILKEKVIEKRFGVVFSTLRLSPKESLLLDTILKEKKDRWENEAKMHVKVLELRSSALRQRMERLTDAYLEGLVEKESFGQKKTALQLERNDAERQITEIMQGNGPSISRYEKIVELIKTAYPLYKCGLFEEKRDVINKVMSNRQASEKALVFTLRFPFSEIVKRNGGAFGGARRGASRTWKRIFEQIGRRLHDSKYQADGLL